jgi:hypothetical protein
MAVSASAKSRAAAISSLIRKEAGFRVTPSGSNRDQGIKVRSAGGGNDYPSIVISDPFEAIHDDAEINRIIEYRRYNVAKALDARGYVYDTVRTEGSNLCIIRITGKIAVPKKTKAQKPRGVEFNESAPQLHLDFSTRIQADTDAARKLFAKSGATTEDLNDPHRMAQLVRYALESVLFSTDNPLWNVAIIEKA